MKWGLKLAGRYGPVDVSDLDFYQYNGYDDKIPPEPEVPEEGEHIWSWFWRLNARRQPGFESTAPLSYEQILYWSGMTRTFVSPEEVEILTAMDDAFVIGIAEGREKKRKRDESRNS